MLVPSPINTPAMNVSSVDKRVDAAPVASAPPATPPDTPDAVAPPSPAEGAAATPANLPPKELDDTPAEPRDLIATLDAPRDSDVEPVTGTADGPFGPPPAFDQSPLQAQRANFPDPPPETPTTAYSALQRIEAPYDPATVDIAR